MAGANGYGTLGQLKALKRLERDFNDWPDMKMRLQSLTDDEIIRISEYARDEGGSENDVIRSLRDREASIAFGTVQPPLAEMAAKDLDGAVAIVKEKIPPGVQVVLSTHIGGLTWRSPSAAYRDFGSGEGSPEAEGDTQPSTSNSANS